MCPAGLFRSHREANGKMKVRGMRWAVAGVLVLALVIGVPGMVRAAPHQQAAETIRLLDTVNGTLDAATREVTTASA